MARLKPKNRAERLRRIAAFRKALGLPDQTKATDQPIMPITEGTLIRPTQTPGAATFRVDRVKRAGWLECTVHSYPDGTKASAEWRGMTRGHWKFRVTEVSAVA